MYPRRKIDCLPLDLRTSHKNSAHDVYKTNWIPECKYMSGQVFRTYHSNTHHTQHQKADHQQERYVPRRCHRAIRQDHNMALNPFWINVGQARGHPGAQLTVTLISILPAHKPDELSEFAQHMEVLLIIEFGGFATPWVQWPFSIDPLVLRHLSSDVLSMRKKLFLEQWEHFWDKGRSICTRPPYFLLMDMHWRWRCGMFRNQWHRYPWIAWKAVGN